MLHAPNVNTYFIISRNQSGIALIEVLVTVLVLAIGFLGLAGLQLTALRNNSSAYERSQATMLAYDIIDRMRANRNAALNGDYSVALNTAPTAADCRGSSANCTTTQLATFDVNQWKCNLGKWSSHASCVSLGITDVKLPNGDGSIVVNGSRATITIQWEDDRSATTAADKLTTFTITTLI
jgi:type IV pilus assembly protein PilV